jgi:cytochrome c-type biogenesis protein CcmH/NrfG
LKNQSRYSYLLLMILLSSFGGGTIAQTQAIQEPSSVNEFVKILAQAQAKTGEKDWTKAAELWEQVVKANPLDGRFWNQLGHAYYYAKNFRKSTAAYEKQIELGGVIPAKAAFNIACNYALLGEKESAIS